MARSLATTGHFTPDMETMLSILEDVIALKDENGTDFSPVFAALPLRQELPDYFRVIKRPMSYNKVRNNIRHGRYQTPQGFVQDLAQISWNARFYNESTSEYYKWAEILAQYVKDTVVPELNSNGYNVRYPDLGNLPPEQQNKSASITPGVLDDEVVNAAFSSATPEIAPIPATTSSDADLPFVQDLPVHSRPAIPSPPYRSSVTTTSRHPVLPNYNPAAYEPHTEQSDHSNMYNPPRISSTVSSSRQLLENWVKRGRPPIVDKPHEQRIKSIMRGLKKVKVNGKTIIAVFDKLPSQQDHPEFYEMIRDPISMLDIKGLIKQRYYKTVDAYMADVFRLINNGKTYYPAIGDKFSANNINLLEKNITRLYYLEMKKPDSDYIGDVESSKLPLPQVVYEGRNYKVGNWVMMKNPNDATRPIPAQIFRLWQEHGKQYLNVCWYYRPEWTTHPYNRLFLENEVFKTGQYRDHAVEDIVGPCYVAYFTRWLKGDPGVKYEGPLFICEFRYNDRELNFAKIRTWKACLPDEVRHIEDPIIPIDQQRILKKYPSPIKHLLPPGSTATTPIPPPTILNLNAPPLVGGIYVNRVEEEEEINYFDSTLRQDQYQLLVPPAVSFHGEQGHSKSPQPQFAGRGGAFGVGGTYLNANGIGAPEVPAPQQTNSDLPPYALSLQQQVASQMESQQLQPQQFLQTDYLGYQSQMSNGSGHKVIHTPFNSMSYQWSPYAQPSFAQSFIQPSERERSLQKFARQGYEQVDEANFERFSKVMTKNNYSDGFTEGMISAEQLKKENGKEPAPLLWFKAPPEYIPNRILSEDVDETLNVVTKKRNLGKGLKAVRLGHSAKYLAWKKAATAAEA